MALSLSQTAPTGVAVNYHVIGSYRLDKGASYATVLVQSYPDQATANSTTNIPLIRPGAPAGAVQAIPTVPSWSQNYNVPVSGDPTMQDLYNGLKALPDFSGAIDA